MILLSAQPVLKASIWNRVNVNPVCSTVLNVNHQFLALNAIHPLTSKKTLQLVYPSAKGLALPVPLTPTTYSSAHGVRLDSNS